MATVAVVGAGLAGLACGRRLQAAGHRVTWFEKSRGVGGRIATRRLEAGSRVDHGLRYWVPQSAELQALTQDLLAQGVVHPWAAQGFRWNGELRPDSGKTVYCAHQGVNAIAKYLAQSCDIRRQHRVTGLARCDRGWRLTMDDPTGSATTATADTVVLAIPAPQAVPLLLPLDAAAAEAARAVTYAPCLSLMATYGDLPPAPPLDHGCGWHITMEDPVLSWVSLDSSKAAPSAVQALLIQSQPEFATDYFQRLEATEPAAVASLNQATVDQMFEAMAALVPRLAQPLGHRLHRWRYSVVLRPYGGTTLTTRWPSLVGCGDWCSPEDMSDVSNVDAAYRSGLATAARVMSVFSSV